MPFVYTPQTSQLVYAHQLYSPSCCSPSKARRSWPETCEEKVTKIRAIFGPRCRALCIQTPLHPRFCSIQTLSATKIMQCDGPRSSADRQTHGLEPAIRIAKCSVFELLQAPAEEETGASLAYCHVAWGQVDLGNVA